MIYIEGEEENLPYAGSFFYQKARVGPDQTQKPRTHFRSFMWVARIQALGKSPAASQVH